VIGVSDREELPRIQARTSAQLIPNRASARSASSLPKG
jgi:hypothetical protein